MNREDHFIGSRRIVERRLLVSKPEQLGLAVSSTYIYTELDQLLEDDVLESIWISPV